MIKIKIGFIDFFDLKLIYSPELFIPRPETEILVSEAIRILEREKWIKKVVDFGTGIGTIIIPLAVRFKKLFIGIDKDLRSLKILKMNAKIHGISVYPMLSDTIPLSKADIIISNPPYIPRALMDNVDDDPNFVCGGEGGYEIITHIIEISEKILPPGGYLLLEVGWDDIKFFEGFPHLMERYKSEVLKKLKNFKFEIKKDLRGIERFVIARFYC